MLRPDLVMLIAVMLAAFALLVVVARGASIPVPVLGQAASALADHRVSVYCSTDSEAAWDRLAPPGAAGFHVTAFTEIYGDVLYLSPPICRTLRTLVARGPGSVDPYAAASAVHTLVHEAMHDLGYGVEGRAECAALSRDRAVAVRWFGYARGSTRLAQFMEDVRFVHLNTPPAYQAFC